MKKRKIIAAGLVLLILLQLLTGCAAIRYGATLYSDAEEWLDDAFLEENKISTAYYRNPDFTDIHGSEPEWITYPDEPKTRTFIITEKEEYDRIFTKSPVEVDFEKEMVILYTFLAHYPGGIKYELKKTKVTDDTLTVEFDRQYIAPVTGVEPYYQAFFMLTMKKTEITEVKFIEMR